jgi:hypothetical protein
MSRNTSVANLLGSTTTRLYVVSNYVAVVGICTYTMTFFGGDSFEDNILSQKNKLQFSGEASPLCFQCNTAFIT